MNAIYQPKHKLLLSCQAESDDGDPLAFTHFDQWPAAKWPAKSNIKTAFEVLEEWSKELDIPQIHPVVIAGSEGMAWEEFYLKSGWGAEYPVALIKAIEIILEDGRYAVYGSDNFIEIYSVPTVRDSMLEEMDEDMVDELIARALEVSEKMTFDPESICNLIAQKAKSLIQEARQHGLILNITSVSETPLAMGNTHEEVALHPVRGTY